jgi:16S rRNA (guanine1207-N2)-methyltransferase
MGCDIRLNDFDLSVFDKASFDTVFYRVSKEKPVVHRLINQLAHYLKPDGCFYVSGYKKEGTKTYIDKAGKYLGFVEEKKLGGKTSMIALLRRDQEYREELDDKNYTALHDIKMADGSTVSSKPGVYGWQKEDRGSVFLIENLPNVLERIAEKNEVTKIADLGCGYGYLSLMASKLIDAHFYATDNNVAAVKCCRENFKRYEVNGDVSLDNCGSQLGSDYDLVLCNPPFHQGFDVDSDLSDRFLRSAARALKKGGVAYFVVNAFIPLEIKASRYFSRVDFVANNRSFKLLLLQK